MKPIAITPGEPAGIGPDIVLKLIPQHTSGTPWVIIADRHLLLQRAHQLGMTLTLPDYIDHAKDELPAVSVMHIPLSAPCQAGIPNPVNASSVIRTLEEATRFCLDKKFSALVTGPVNKAVINQGGIAFLGHTELLAQLTGVSQPVMMMVSPHYRVALFTSHVPLAQVPSLLSTEKLTRCIEIIDHDLKMKLGIAKPRILICGLNPHAGESGYVGREEINIIQPTIAALNQRHFQLIGPVAADIAFTVDSLRRADVVLALYHDQGLPVIKAQGFGQLFNVTLGLPIIRTSVDHGTAFSLAGTGHADASSLHTAIHLAEQMVHCCQATDDRS